MFVTKSTGVKPHSITSYQNPFCTKLAILACMTMAHLESTAQFHMINRIRATKSSAYTVAIFEAS